MRKWIKISIWTLLLAGIAVLCVVRWQAWFGLPQELHWTGDTISTPVHTFAGDSVNGFVLTNKGWQDTVEPGKLDIMVLGDIHSRLRRDDYDTLAARVHETEMIVQLGDWMERGQLYYQQLLLREWTNSDLWKLPVVNCPGNHEYSKGVEKSLSPYWMETFPYTTENNIVPGVNYHVDFPNLRLISIDTNPLNHIVYLTRELTWLDGLLKTANGRFVVVIMHHPVFAAGKGRVNPHLFAAFHHALNKADLVLAGHDHSYARRMPFVVTNTSGKTKQQRTRHSFDLMSDQPSYIHLSVTDSALLLRTYQMSDGELIDSIYVQHR